MNTCDIIIPAYNNTDTLPQVLAALSKQNVPGNWSIQVIVCDDGSTDDSVVKVQDLSASQQTKIHTIVLPAEHKGAAAARNRGLKASGADVILFLGADIVLRPGALAAHLNFHEQYPEDTAAALGFVMWDPRVQPTPLMEWMIHGGPQNNFDEVLGLTTADAQNYFYASHISLKRSLLADEQFSEAYTEYGHEDKDFGRRLKLRGLALHVLQGAIGLHRHYYTAESFFARQWAVGSGQHVFNRDAGLADPRRELTMRHTAQRLLYSLGIGMVLRTLTRFFAPRYATPRLFAHVANYEYRRGLFHRLETSYPQGFPQ